MRWGLKARANNMYCKVVFDVPIDRDFDYVIPEELAEKIVPGKRVTAPFGPKLTCGLVTNVSEVCTAPAQVKLKEIVSVVDEKPLFGSDLFPLAQFMKNHWGGPIGQILFSLVPPQPYYKLSSVISPFSVSSFCPSFTWTPSQQQALAQLHASKEYTFESFLFNGPSFTGKTETILHLAGECLAGYGQVLITVPDIAASKQLILEAQQRFREENVFCWHSRMLLSKKKKYFSDISNGRPCVVIATRSGALLPFKNLRLVAMLDEGDDNYKQEENKPYYHARELLYFRAKMHGAKIIYVSPTPSVELLQQVKGGTLREICFTHSLPQHCFQPQLKLLPKKGEKSRIFSDFLLAQLTENLARHETSLLILNRRGYANAYYCLNCGTYAVCKKCGAILTREKEETKGDYLHCKKCGAVETLTQICPKCKNEIFKSRGGGTQKIVTEIAKLFPQAKLLRLDSDTLKKKEDQGFKALQALQQGSADIIVGTRLASGALRGAKVTLAAVLDAELELDGPDFRSNEKYTQLLFELRGHLSGLKNGRLLIQTSTPEKYDYEPLFNGSYAQAAQQELTLRESFNYPPFVRLIRVTIKCKEKALLQAETERIQHVAAMQVIEVLGPVWCAKKTDTLLKQYLLLKVDSENYLNVMAQLDSFVPAKKATVQIIADPYNFY